jgi:hypothetical protein
MTVVVIICLLTVLAVILWAHWQPDKWKASYPAELQSQLYQAAKQTAMQEAAAILHTLQLWR